MPCRLGREVESDRGSKIDLRLEFSRNAIVRGRKSGGYLDFEDEVLDHASSEVDSIVDKETKGLKVGIPTIHFIESSTGDNERITPQGWATVGIVHPLHGQGEQTRL